MKPSSICTSKGSAFYYLPLPVLALLFGPLFLAPRDSLAIPLYTNSAIFYDTNDLGRCAKPLMPGRGKCPDCPTTGMPRFWVTTPYVSLWLADEPLSYTMSSGQTMAFRWTYQHRAALTGPVAARVYDVSPPWVPVRLDASDFAVGDDTFDTMTNATWCHHWGSDIVFWDSSLESSQTAPTDYVVSPPAPATPTNAYFPMSIQYQGVVRLGDGGIIPFSFGNASTPSGSSLGVRVQYLGPESPNYGPEIPLNPSNGGDFNYPTDSQGVVWISNPQYGFQVLWPDGSRDLYGFVLLDHTSLNSPPSPYREPVDYRFTWTYNNTARAYLTQHIDPQGRATTLGYQTLTPAADQPSWVVRYVVDPDGRTNTYTYNSNNLYQLQQIQDAYGQTATFGYDGASGMLTSITDAAGLTSSFQYDAPQMYTITNSGPPPAIFHFYYYDGLISNLFTPYGQTTFYYYDVQPSGATSGEYASRSILVSEPQGAYQLYYFCQSNGLSETSYLTSGVPAVPGWTFDNGTLSSSNTAAADLQYRNTYEWGREQFANAVPAASLRYWVPPTGSLSQGLGMLTAANYHQARLKHWLLNGSDPSQSTITDWISSERPPSPDVAGLILPPRTWYGYWGQTGASAYETTSYTSLPWIGCQALSLPDGATQFESRLYDGYGNLATQQVSYARSNGSVGTLTNWFAYSTNHVDLLAVTNSAGQWANLGYNARHEVLAITNALGQVSTLSWDPSTFNLTGIVGFDGQSASLAYYSASGNGANNALLQSVSVWPQGRSTTIAAYSNALPQVVHVSGMALPDLWLTNSWDGLNRLTGTLFQDGSSISNVYTYLDLTGHQDRLGHWSYYGFDSLEHLISVTNANNAVTVLSWCGCGALTAITDPLTNTTSFNYNNQGLLTNILYPDGSTLNYAYDPVERLITLSDGQSRSLNFTYNNQGLVTTISNAYGQVQGLVYDALNRPIQVTDANLVTITNQYDVLNRLLLRTWPDNISEGFLWSSNGLVAYTNRDNEVTSYGRDNAGRLLTLTNANNEVNQFAYNALNQLILLTNGVNAVTTWQYNQYGWLTNKIDGLGRNAFRFAYNANGWLTNRWTPEKGNTAYTLDNLGNVLAVIYPGQTNTYSYAADNRRTNMVDPIGATAFTYTPVGRQATETTPWNTTLNYSYSQGLLTNLTIQPSGSPSIQQSFAYDSAWRVTETASPAGAFSYTYGYHPASPLVTGIQLPNDATIVNVYDALGRLNETALNNYWGHTLDGEAYQVDPLGLRTNITRYFGLGTNSVAIGYDAIGQVLTWTAKESSGLSRQNEQLSFGYDAADNLHFRTNGSLAQSFTVDPANQLTNVTRAGPFTLNGATAEPMTNVIVNGAAAQTYGDFTFAATNNTLANGTNNFTVIARNVYGLLSTNSFAANLPATNTLLFDNNGNPTNDGTRSFAYSWENQLTNITVASQWRSDFVYDGLGRRRVERDYAWQSNAWAKTNELHFIYDGFLLVQVQDANSNVLVTYTRGLDLSGTRLGAGGIGGLLARTDTNGTAFYHSDGGGNVTALIDENEVIQARYLYGPFGKLVGQWGPLAAANAMQFSSMPFHAQSGLSLYPARAYEPTLQRWLNRDPIGENGGINLYTFVRNNPANFMDPLGLQIPPAAMDELAQLSEELQPEEEALEAEAETLWSKVVDFFSNKANQNQVNQGLGRAAERVSCPLKNTTRIESLSGTANYRVPDLLDKSLQIIGDTKNVQYLSMSPQLQDYVSWAQQNNYTFQLTVNVNTVLSSSVINAVPNIIRQPLP